MELDRRICSRARLARDPRFDGKFFIGVLTTKIYCRPMCRSRTSKESNVRYFPSAAAAEEAGFRPCLRCRPEQAPGTRAWPGTQNTVSRALHLISETGLEDGGVEALADHLGIGARHLRRLFLRHLGASPSTVAQTRRLQFAKKLIDETTLRMGQIALASGFGCVRRFNAAIRGVYARTPTQIRCLAQQKSGEPEGQYVFHLTFRPPYDWNRMLDFLAARSILGVEVSGAGSYRRTVFVDDNPGYFEVSLNASGDALSVRVHIPNPHSLFLIVERVRAMFDLDADWATIVRTLESDPMLASHVARNPGLRIPGCWSAFEVAIRAVLEQQLDPKSAGELLGRMVTSFGSPFGLRGMTHLFPAPGALAGAQLESIGWSRRAADAVRTLARALKDGKIRLDKVADPEALLARLSEMPGIGPPAAQWVAMRALREPDAFPSHDPAVARALGTAGPVETESRSHAWSPWRAYAAVYLLSFGTSVSTCDTASAAATRLANPPSALSDQRPMAPPSTGAIVREIVKYAQDAYLRIPPRQLAKEKLERAIVISRHRDASGKGHLFVEDNGIGVALEGLRRSLAGETRRQHTDGPEEFALLRLLRSLILSGAGSKIIIESMTKGVRRPARLELNVRRLYGQLGAQAKIEKILSNSEFLSLSAEDCDRQDHGTTLELECDGNLEIVNGRELNRLYALTDPENESLETMLIDSFGRSSEKSVLGEQLHEIDERTRDLPVGVYLDGKTLEWQVPLQFRHNRSVRVGALRAIR